MLFIRVPQHSPRLTYTCDLIFDQILRIPYTLVLPEEAVPQGDPLINYTTTETSKGLSIPNSGLLFETNISAQTPQLVIADLPYLFADTSSQADLNFDVFSAVFYLVSEYGKYVHTHLDQHDRYIHDRYVYGKLKLDTLPLIHLYSEQLWKAICDRFSEVPERPESSFDYRITIDVDNPWKYLNKGPWIAFGGIAKDIFRANWTGVRERVNTHLTGTDPFHTFEQLYELCPTEKTDFFFLLDRHSNYDSRFTWRLPAYQALMRDILQRGYSCGIHPSYTASAHPERIRTEKQALENILAQPVVHSRQHFLRYRLPGTFRVLTEAGIRQEYSSCLFQTGGFPAGMAQPYLWFDLEKNEVSTLTLWPTILMERTLQQYLALSPEAALDRARQLIATAKQVGGTFVFLLHNDSLSESGEWKGWSGVMQTILEELVAEAS